MRDILSCACLIPLEHIRTHMKNTPVLVWSSVTKKFAVVSHELGRAMLYIGNTEGFDRLTSRFKPKAVRVNEQTPGELCVTLDYPNESLCNTSPKEKAEMLICFLESNFGVQASRSGPASVAA